MNASGNNFLPKTRGYVKIGVGSQYWLAKNILMFSINGGNTGCSGKCAVSAEGTDAGTHDRETGKRIVKGGTENADQEISGNRSSGNDSNLE